MRLNDKYQMFKKERGYVDYIDLEILFLELLSNDNVREQIQHDYDLVLVDEFQDTNPLQLAIFQSLRSLTKRTCWVGDPKQAIYSFRDTDPELVNRVWNRKGNTDCRELKENYRSQVGLVQFVGRAFEASLGAEAKQNPKKPSVPRGLERWLLETKNNADEATALAVGIAKLKEEGTRLGDIAVLEKTNSALADLAIALDQVGIPYLLESPGLFSTREGALVLSGLRLTADRNDSLAAATILHLKSNPDVATPKWLEERLREVRARDDAKELHSTTENAPPAEWQSPWHGDPTLAKLEALNREILPPSVIVQQVIEALEIPVGIRNWTDPVRRCAHLDSILKHACNYEDTTLHAGEAATLTGLILYLEELSGSGTDNRHPPLGHDAVTLMTYHGAKGLEWPTVILSGLDSERDPDVWLPIAHGGSHSDINPLEGRSLRYWIWPFGTDNSQFKRRIRGSGLEDDALASQEGASAREKSIEESIRLLYVGCTRAKQKLVFAHRPAKYDWLKQIADIDVLLDPSLEDGEHELLGMDTTLVIRRLNAEADEHIAIADDAANWFATQERVQRIFAKRFHSPSSVKSNEQANVRVEDLIGPSLFPSGAKEEHYSAIGDATHTYLGAMPSMLSLTDAQKHVIAER
ncbi:MAG: UvrD-helicase domain-containing protein, partial [Pirellula staleyi]